jgi:hypothetical protein
MSATLIRALVAAIVAVALLVQARQAQGVWRTRTFGLGSAGFALIAISNLIAGPGMEVVALPLIALAALLITGALACLWQAYRVGELYEQISRARDALDQARNEQRK